MADKKPTTPPNQNENPKQDSLSPPMPRPAVGRIVHYWLEKSDAGGRSHLYPLAGIITEVLTSDDMRAVSGVNLKAFGQKGEDRTHHMVHFSKEKLLGKWTWPDHA